MESGGVGGAIKDVEEERERILQKVKQERERLAKDEREKSTTM